MIIGEASFDIIFGRGMCQLIKSTAYRLSWRIYPSRESPPAVNYQGFAGGSGLAKPRSYALIVCGGGIDGRDQVRAVDFPLGEDYE